MRITYDLRCLTDRMHGMARYGLEVMKALLELDRENDLAMAVLVRSPRHAAQWLPKDPRLVAVVRKDKPYGLHAQLFLPKFLRRLDTQIYHCPYYAPAWLINRTFTFAVHDLIPLVFPQDHGRAHRLFFRLVVGPALRNARAVFTVSEQSKKDLRRFMGTNPNRVVVTPNGVGPAFGSVDPAQARAKAQALGLPPAYVLGVGNPKPHKNLGALVQAHAGMDQAPPLVLVGVAPGQLRNVRPSERLLMLPNLEDADLATAYQAAQAVCVPSLYEGFGLPALEAMACGAPLVASERGGLPEVVGDAGVLCEPTPEALAESLGRVLGDASLAGRLRLAGPERAQRFTWKKAAQLTYQTWREILAGKR